MKNSLYKKYAGLCLSEEEYDYIVKNGAIDNKLLNASQCFSGSWKRVGVSRYTGERVTNIASRGESLFFHGGLIDLSTKSILDDEHFVYRYYQAVSEAMFVYNDALFIVHVPEIEKDNRNNDAQGIETYKQEEEEKPIIIPLSRIMDVEYKMVNGPYGKKPDGVINIYFVDGRVFGSLITKDPGVLLNSCKTNGNNWGWEVNQLLLNFKFSDNIKEWDKNNILVTKMKSLMKNGVNYDRTKRKICNFLGSNSNVEKLIISKKLFMKELLANKDKIADSSVKGILDEYGAECIRAKEQKKKIKLDKYGLPKIKADFILKLHYILLALLFIAVPVIFCMVEEGATKFMLVAVIILACVAWWKKTVAYENYRLQEKKAAQKQISVDDSEYYWKIIDTIKCRYSYKDRELIKVYEQCKMRGIEKLDSSNEHMVFRKICDEFNVEIEEDILHFFDRCKSIYEMEKEDILLVNTQILSDKKYKEEESIYLLNKELASLIGIEKYVSKSLDTIRELESKIESRDKLKKYLRNTTPRQAKHTDWAIAGGLASGIAGPAAGIMVASSVQEENRKADEWVKKEKERILDQLKGLSQLDYKDQDKRDVLQKSIDELKNRMIDTDNSEKWFELLSFANITHTVTPTGMMEISVEIAGETVKIGNTKWIIDGSIVVNVYEDEKLVGDAYIVADGYGDIELQNIGFTTQRSNYSTYAKAFNVRFNAEKNYSVRFVPYHLWAIEK